MKNSSLVIPKKNLNKLFNCNTFGCINCDNNHDEYVKELEEDALLLEGALSKKKTRFMIHSGTMCDCKLPLNKKLEITRKTLDVVYKYAYGMTILTKHTEILEDIEKLVEINDEKRVVIMTPISTSEEYINKKVDPNSTSIKERFEMLSKFNKRGIDTVVWITPILPFINDTTTNIKGILDLCKKTGVKAIMTSNLGVSLNEQNKEYFYDKLDKFPGIKEKYVEQFEYSNNISTAQNIKLENIIFKFCEQNNIIYETDNVFDFIDFMPERESLFDFEF